MISHEAFVRTLLVERVEVLGYIQSLVRQPDVAEDVFQHICTAAVQNQEQINDEEHLLKWLRVAGRRQAMNVLRKRKEEQFALDQDVQELMDPVWQNSRSSKSDVLADALRECLLQLSKSHQELVHKRFVDNYEYDRLADERSQTVNSLYVMFSRIYAALGKCIATRVPHAGIGGRHVG